MKGNLIIVWMVFITAQLSAQNADLFFEKTDTFLKKNVENGKVDYASIHTDPSDLNELLILAEDISVSKEEASIYQAFWINAYNLAVIKGIVDHFPTKSPLSHSGFFDKFTYKLGGQDISLNDIEHKLLRAQFKDARFHFVLVCGAIGCPPLINRAYLPETLDFQLQKQTELALNGDYFISIDHQKKRIYGSEILKWYKKDFTRKGFKEIDFINSFRTEKIPNTYKLHYSTYNWSLNIQTPQ